MSGMPSPFGWRRSAQQDPSEVFTQSLPPGPLRAHLGNLHALFRVQQAQHPYPDQMATTFEQQMMVFEAHLRQIARYTQTPLHELDARQRRFNGTGVRKQFKIKPRNEEK